MSNHLLKRENAVLILKLSLLPKPQQKSIKNKEWGIGHWALGMGHGKNAIRYRTGIKNRASLIPIASVPIALIYEYPTYYPN
jgi:hypothetical protein